MELMNEKVLWTTRVILFTECVLVREGSPHKAELRGCDLNLSGSGSLVERESENFEFCTRLDFYRVRTVIRISCTAVSL